MATFQYAYVEALQLLFELQRYAELVVEHCSRSDALGVQIFVGVNDSIEILSDNLWSAFSELQEDAAARKVFEKYDFLKTVRKQQFLEAFTWGLGLRTRKSSYYDSETRKPVNVKRVVFPAPPDFHCVEPGSYRACVIPHWFDAQFVRAALLQAWEMGTRDRHVKKLRTLERDRDRQQSKRPQPIHHRHVQIYPPQGPYLALPGTTTALPAHQMYYVATPVTHPQASHELPNVPYYHPPSLGYHNATQQYGYAGGSNNNHWQEHHLSEGYVTSGMQHDGEMALAVSGGRDRGSLREPGVAGLPFVGRDPAGVLLGKRTRATHEEDSRSYGSLSQEACSGSSGNPEGERVRSRVAGKQASDWCSSEQVSAGGYHNNEEHTSRLPLKAELYSIPTSARGPIPSDRPITSGAKHPSPPSPSPFPPQTFSGQPLSPVPTTTPAPHPTTRPSHSQSHHSPATMSNISNLDRASQERTMQVSTGAVIANPSQANMITSTPPAAHNTPDSSTRERVPTPTQDSTLPQDSNRPGSNTPTQLSQPGSCWEPAQPSETHLSTDPLSLPSTQEEEHPDLVIRQSQHSVTQPPSSQPSSTPLDPCPSPSPPPSEAIPQNVPTSSIPSSQPLLPNPSKEEDIAHYPSVSGPVATCSGDEIRLAVSQPGLMLSPHLADNSIAPIPKITIRGPAMEPSHEGLTGSAARGDNLLGEGLSTLLRTSGGGSHELGNTAKGGGREHRESIPHFRDSNGDEDILTCSEATEDVSMAPGGFGSVHALREIKRIPIGREIGSATSSQEKLKNKRPRITSVLMASPRSGGVAPTAFNHSGGHSSQSGGYGGSHEGGFETAAKIGSGTPISGFPPGVVLQPGRGEHAGGYVGTSMPMSEAFLHGAPSTPQRNPRTPQKNIPGTILFTPPPSGPYSRTTSSTLSPPSLFPDPGLSHPQGGLFSRPGQTPTLSPLSQYYRSTHAPNFISIAGPQHQPLSPPTRTPFAQSPPPKLTPPSTFLSASHSDQLMYSHSRHPQTTPSKVSVRSMTDGYSGRVTREPMRGQHSLSEGRASRSVSSEQQHGSLTHSEHGGPSHSHPAGTSSGHFPHSRVDDHFSPPNPWGQTTRRAVAVPPVVEDEEMQGPGQELVAQAGGALAAALQYALQEIRMLTEKVEMLEDRISVLEGEPPGEGEGPPA